MKLNNALNYIEHLGVSSDSVRRLSEECNKKDSRWSAPHTPSRYFPPLKAYMFSL